MLLKCQQGMPLSDWVKCKSALRILSLSDSDSSDSPELDQQTAEVVHSNYIAKLLPSLLPMHSISDGNIGDGDEDHQRCRLDVVKKQLQLQLTHLRERRMTYKHQEFDSSEDHEDAVALNDAIRNIDQTDLLTWRFRRS